MPVELYSDWSIRDSDKHEQVEPYRSYYILCEGKNTEAWYFEGLIRNRKLLSIHPLIEIVHLRKTEEHENVSAPKRLVVYANELITNGELEKYDVERDKIIVVFDADIFENNPDQYSEVLSLGREMILGVTNPSFELFLLLHKENSVNEIILPNQTDIVSNKHTNRGRNRIRYIEKLFRDTFKMRPKSNKKIGELSQDVLIAIEQEKKINQKIEHCQGHITSNIGLIICSIINDHCD